jgi:hypothetical protein
LKKTLPLFWWLRQRHYSNQPHAYVCPLLMTISAILWCLRGKRARWSAARWGICRDRDGGEDFEVEGWITPARIVIGHCEAPCLFPRRLIEAECDFWNSRIGLRLRSR